MNTPKPSLLEIYVEILQSMEKLQTCSLHTIQQETNLGKTDLAKAVAFLEKQDLVRKDTVENQTVYSTTARGDKVSRYFSGHPEQQEQTVNMQ